MNDWAKARVADRIEEKKARGEREDAHWLRLHGEIERRTRDERCQHSGYKLERPRHGFGGRDGFVAGLGGANDDVSAGAGEDVARERSGAGNQRERDRQAGRRGGVEHDAGPQTVVV